jgi:aspartate/methionine/tyrosine aminotransferase
MAVSRMASRFAAERLKDIPTMTVWTEFTPMCVKYGAVNLGQGFPNFAPSELIRKHAAAAVADPDPLSQQYARGWGDLRLVGELQKRYTALLGRDVGVEEVMVCNGTTQALNLCTTAFVNPEEEVIVIEPYFDLYDNDVMIAHGRTKFVPLRPAGTTSNEWTLDMALLESRITKGKTKAIVVNTPMNVPGKVWSRAELEKIAEVAIRNDLLVFADEVYDQFVYDGCAHFSIASLPGMWERTLTMCSAGKMFTVTGWKIGWVVAPKALLVPCVQVQAHQCFSVATPLQVAVANAMAEVRGGDFFKGVTAGYLKRRELLIEQLASAGLPAVVPQGSYFVMADISKVPPAAYEAIGSQPDVAGAPTDVAKDWKFCRWMVREVGVGCLPCTAFCSRESAHLFSNYVRFAFCKKESDLVEAGRRMREKLRPVLAAAGTAAPAAAAPNSKL